MGQAKQREPDRNKRVDIAKLRIEHERAENQKRIDAMEAALTPEQRKKRYEARMFVAAVAGLFCPLSNRPPTR